MAQKIERYNDGSQNPPRLRPQQSQWALLKLPMNAETEWTLDEKFARCKAAGFEAVECWINDETEKEITETLKRHELRLGMGHRPYKVDDTKAAVERAVRCGADYLFAQPGSAYTPLDDVVTIVTEGRKIANDAGIPFFVETHRNNFTETIPQTRQLIDRVPDIRMTGDLSHFVVVGEFYGWEEEGASDKMMPVLERISHLHGRISDGEAAQVDVGDGSGQTPQFFVKLWSIAMTHWLKGAGPGDVFPFTSELGPPRYALTLPNGQEYSDRWEQALVMKRLAEQAFEQAKAAAG